jgi:two-component system response regulator FixJ
MIFIVDDDPAVRHSLALLLQCEGVDSQGFGSARAFLDHCRPSNDDRLIVDVDLPGMDGVALVRALRAQGLTLPAVVITGKPSTFVRQQALEAGATAFIEKPVDLGQLIELVRDRKTTAS